MQTVFTAGKQTMISKSFPDPKQVAVTISAIGLEVPRTERVQQSKKNHHHRSKVCETTTKEPCRLTTLRTLMYRGKMRHQQTIQDWMKQKTRQDTTRTRQVRGAVRGAVSAEGHGSAGVSSSPKYNNK